MLCDVVGVNSGFKMKTIKHARFELTRKDKESSSDNDTFYIICGSEGAGMSCHDYGHKVKIKKVE
jgi:hypothetical protein